MNEFSFYDDIAQKLGISYQEAKKSVNALLECITEEMLKGEKVKIVNFGNFEVVNRAARKGHNPHTNEIFDIPACREPVFRPGKGLKELIRNS